MITREELKRQNNELNKLIKKLDSITAEYDKTNDRKTKEKLLDEALQLQAIITEKAKKIGDDTLSFLNSRHSKL